MFITFEGPEGSGKTSVANEIVRILISKGYDVLYTREPGGTPIAEEIRNIILDKKNTALDARAEALLYAASRRQHLVEKVWPALNEGKIVISDRFLDSSLAYQGAGRNIGVDNVLNINLFATEGTYPDLTLLFDITPEKGLERIAINKKREVNRLDLEALDFHRQVREAFLELAKKYQDRYVIIDASKTLPEVVGAALNVIQSRLEQKHARL
ncbi:MAG: dTMP kinase [Bacilli bacterium]|jgi:dTMP kinase|nr:dTMP kinase [Bacilli bacterium]